MTECLQCAIQRCVAIRRLLHLGQVVRFYDWKHDQMRMARIVQMKDTQVLLQETETRVQWTLPYGHRATSAGPSTPQRHPRHHRHNRQGLCVQTSSVGDKVSFVDRNLHARSASSHG